MLDVYSYSVRLFYFKRWYFKMNIYESVSSDQAAIKLFQCCFEDLFFFFFVLSPFITVDSFILHPVFVNNFCRCTVLTLEYFVG